LHVVAFGSQCFVVAGVQVQSGAGVGGGVGLAEGGGSSVPLPPATPDDEDPLLPGVDPLLGAVPPLPAQPHAAASCVHLKSSPQLASVVQGKS
jgi:hypothetical protein